MGEIIYSLSIGAFLIATGLVMNAVLRREEKRVCGKNGEMDAPADGTDRKNDT